MKTHRVQLLRRKGLLGGGAQYFLSVVTIDETGGGHLHRGPFGRKRLCESSLMVIVQMARVVVHSADITHDVTFFEQLDGIVATRDGRVAPPWVQRQHGTTHGVVDVETTAVDADDERNGIHDRCAWIFKS